MRLATLRRGGRDGTLALPASDGRSAVPSPAGVPTLQAALDDWTTAAAPLLEVARQLEAGVLAAVPTADGELHSPLPRAYQWCDASAYLTHMERIRRARGMALPPDYGSEPIVYQSGSDVILAPTDPIPFFDEADGLDLEATVAVVTDDVPAGTSAADAPSYIRLVLLTNDVTLRNLLPREYAKSVGPYQAKPPRAFTPFAATPEWLGAAWDGRTLSATIRVQVNGELLGELRADEDLAFDFGDLIAYLAARRSLAAGTIVGSGTVSNADPARGFGCLAERRAVEAVVHGEPTTPLLQLGDHVRIEAFDDRGRSLFGALDQRVARYPAVSPHPEGAVA